MNKIKNYPMISDKKYFTYSNFPENLSEDPSQRYTKINFDKWWDVVDKTHELTMFQYVEILAKRSLNILAKSTNINRERIKNIYFIDILDFLTKSQFICHVFTNSIGKYPLIPYIEKSSKQSSTNEIIWLEYRANKLQMRIHHSCYLSQKEQSIEGKRKFPDGFGYKNNKYYLFEYYGCYFHGCPKCYPDLKNKYDSIVESEKLY